ncbi:MAG: hypothetical protein CL927_00405 [Deltaproteobacteria bacterium]|nr:hypothetical protein [Deltaproteobacteria bacterium]HCH65758.1 hypothetical protein [Deltaproteobacteria bacterium]
MSNPSQSLVRALEHVERAPASADAWLGLGAAFLAAARPGSAVEALEHAVTLSPARSDVWQHLGLARRQVGQHEQGCRALERAVALAPTDAFAWGNFSAALESCGDAKAAAEAALKAAELDPQSGGWWAAYGNALRADGDISGALAAYDEAERRAPGDVRVAWNRALALLSAHRFTEGFQAYEVRSARPQHRALPQPVWTSGEPPPEGVVVHHEQGFGDTLQWARFLPRLAQRTSRVVVAAPERLHGLLQSVDGVDAVISREQVSTAEGLQAVGCTAHVGLMSLGARLQEDGQALAPAAPVFAVDPQAVAHWRDELHDGRPLVAIAWQGNPAYERDHLRSPPLPAFEPALRVPGVRWISIQKFHGLEQLHEAPASMPIVDLGARLDLQSHAFIDTAAVMSAADLIITGDTSTAHLAGALCRPTWVVLSRPADWRWGHLPHRTPWYPSMRLFRQPSPGDWASVFSSVAASLGDWIGKHSKHAVESP